MLSCVDKCSQCTWGREVWSENGCHYKCCLPPKKATNCLLDIDDQFERRYFPVIDNPWYAVDVDTILDDYT